MTELLDFCLDQLLLAPPGLEVHQLVDSTTRTGMSKQFAHRRFKEQQSSILTSSPDHPLYGRGYLWLYELEWTEANSDQWRLRILRNEAREPTPREAILLASVTEDRMPFPSDRAVFKSAKARMLGKESSRQTGSIHRQLRPAVANVQFLCQGGRNFVTAVDPTATVSIIS